ncbi:copper resistance CopC family protein [Nonomuraea sp. CA-143628]|uniref:copper resistance CopC family protein n=1 Tax=Nonomuraea sp. CA-143628 TaxID=3239997 RepID=UPI003D906F3F
MPTFFRRTLVAVIGCGLFLSATAPAALAHDSLKSSSPAKGATVSGIQTIELEYSSRVRFPLVVLRTADGKTIRLGEPQADGPKVSTTVPTQLAGGSYVIAWRVVSSDGHPIEGEIPFTVKGGATASATEAASAAPATSAESTRPAAAAQAGGGIPGWLWGGLAALVVAGLAVWLLSRRTGGPSDPDSPVDPAGQPTAPTEQPDVPAGP